MYGADLIIVTQAGDKILTGPQGANTLIFNYTVPTEAWYEIWMNTAVIAQASPQLVSIQILDDLDTITFIYEGNLNGIGADFGNTFAGRRWYLYPRWKVQIVVLTVMAGGDTLRSTLSCLQLRNLNDPTEKETTSAIPSTKLGRSKTAIAS